VARLASNLASRFRSRREPVDAMALAVGRGFRGVPTVGAAYAGGRARGRLDDRNSLTGPQAGIRVAHSESRGTILAAGIAL